MNCTHTILWFKVLGSHSKHLEVNNLMAVLYHMYISFTLLDGEFDLH